MTEKVSEEKETAAHGVGNSNDEFAALCAQVVADHPHKPFDELCVTLNMRHGERMNSTERRGVLERAIQQVRGGELSPPDKREAAPSLAGGANSDDHDTDADLTSHDDAKGTTANGGPREAISTSEGTAYTASAPLHVPGTVISAAVQTVNAPGTIIGFVSRTVYGEAPSLDTARLEALPRTAPLGVTDDHAGKANNSSTAPQPEPEPEWLRFLTTLYPNGPWQLTAIHPESNNIETITATDIHTAEGFVLQYNGQRNLYYALNPLRGSLDKKAKKTDVAAIAFVHGDLDPNDDETTETAKARFIAALEPWRPHLIAVVDSGNGIQAIGRLPTNDLIALGKPVWVKDDNDKNKLVFTPEDAERVAEFEARLEAWMLDLGSVAGTQNIDRILRLPGTWNLPSKAKLEKGRQRCLSQLLLLNAGTEFPLDKLPPPKAKKKEQQQDDESSSEEGTDESDSNDLDDLIRTGGAKLFGGDRSKAVWKVINLMLRLGYLQRIIIATLLDKRNGISAHVLDQKGPRAYAERQVTKANKQIKFAINDESHKPYVSQNNMRIALLKMGVTVCYDEFANHVLIDGLKDFGPALDDAAMIRLRLTVGQRFDFLPGKEMFFDVVNDVARRNKFHPVRDYLDGLRWDGVERLDHWLATYAGAEDNEYTSAVGALWLIAAVRRVRKPGCKFDEMLVFEFAAAGPGQVVGAAHHGGARRVVHRQPGSQRAQQRDDRADFRQVDHRVRRAEWNAAR